MVVSGSIKHFGKLRMRTCENRGRLDRFLFSWLFLSKLTVVTEYSKLYRAATGCTDPTTAALLGNGKTK